MLRSIYNGEMKTVHVIRVKLKPEVCTDYCNAMGGADFSDQYFVTNSTTRE
jgi:hypothetical protein